MLIAQQFITEWKQTTEHAFHTLPSELLYWATFHEYTFTDNNKVIVAWAPFY